MPNEVLAKEKIKAAADLCAEAGQALDRYELFKTTRDGVKGKVPAAATVIDPQILVINTDLTEAEKKAKKREFEPATALLDQIAQKCVDAAAIKTASDKYEARLLLVQTPIGVLTTTSPRKNDATIGADIEKTDEALKKATDEAAKTPTTLAQFETVLKNLEEADVRCKAAAAKKTMKGNNAPSEPDLKKIMEGPGGAKLLDEIVAGLGTGARRSAVRGDEGPLRSRFGRVREDSGTNVPLAPEAGATPDADLSIAKIYELMTKVPESHVKDNPSFKKVRRRPGDDAKGSYYSGAEGEVVIGQGRPDTSDERTLGLPTELEAIDLDSVSKGGPAPNFFDWNTLHEVGHAVDDKKSFMKKNIGNADYAGWEWHGADVTVVAKAAEGKFSGITPDMIAKYLSEGTEPGLITRMTQDWTKCKAWCDGIRHGKIPWKAGSQCGKTVENGGFQIDGRIYHEAYQNDWYSYLAANRAKGVTGYQFRAPGEWFCELYAAFGTGKMNDNHPAQPWLKKIFKVK